MKKNIYNVVYAFLGALVFTLISSTDLILPISNVVDDSVYQNAGVPDERIVVIGIDSYALEEFGAWPWDRSLIAQAVSYLNSDPENSPAVIGIDIIYDATSNSDSDSALVEAFSKIDNVVLSSYSTIQSGIVNLPGGSFYVDPNLATDLIEPFDELKEVTMQGHVNAMLDTDGVLRHALWDIQTQQGEIVPSFNRVIAEKYCEEMSMTAPKTPPLDAENRWYVVQQSAPGAYSDRISVAELINGTANPQFFKDKIVLIGPYDTSFKDEYITAIDHATNMAGVEYQANAIGALLAGDTKMHAEVGSKINLFVLSFLSFYLFPLIGIIKAALVGIFTCAVWFFGCVVLFDFGYMLNIIYVPIAIFGAYIYSVVRYYFEESYKREQVSQTFRRYVAPEIVNELLTGSPETLKLGGNATTVAVLFVDIRGFTELSTRISATSVVDMLNSILTFTTDCILRNRGTLDKYIGDCTMAFWGAPLPQNDIVYKAVKTAMEMKEGMSEVTRQIKEKFGHEIGFGIGVAYGTVVVGNIGSSTRMDYTIIGDAVNTASRLESNAPSGEILVTESVAKELEDRVKFTSLGNSIKLKGKGDEFEVFRVEKLL